MTSSRPYLLQAIHAWLTDNNLTPYLLVDAEHEQVVVPIEHIQDGKIILNIGYNAVKDLVLDTDLISFNARFSGKPMEVFVPMDAALALYAAENGKGMVFPEEISDEDQPANSSEHSQENAPKGLRSVAKKEVKKTDKKSTKTKAPFLKVIK